MTSLQSRDFLMKLSLQLLYIFLGRICFTVLASVATCWEKVKYLDKSKPQTEAQRMIQKLFEELNRGGELKVLAGTVLVDLWKFPCIRLLPDSVKPTHPGPVSSFSTFPFCPPTLPDPSSYHANPFPVQPGDLLYLLFSGRSMYPIQALLVTQPLSVCDL